VVPLGIGTSDGLKKETRMTGYHAAKKFDDVLSRFKFNTIHERDGQIQTHTGIASRGKKYKGYQQEG